MGATAERRAAQCNSGSANGQEVLEPPQSRALPIASRGLRTTQDVKALAFSLAEDVIRGSIAPKLAGQAVNCVRAGLQTLAMEQRYAEALKRENDGGLMLDSPAPESQEDEEIRALEKLLAEKKSARGNVVNKTPEGARVA